MRTTLALPIGLALALVPGRASADPPRVELRLEYVRGSGGEACPAEPKALRAEVAARLGYDPFEGASAPERLAVVMMAKGHGFAARVERFNAAGVSTWSETFPMRPLRGDCTALTSPLASYLRGMFLTYESGPAAPPVAPTEPAVPLPKPAAPAPSPPSAPPPDLRDPPVQPAHPPAPPSVPNPTRATARNVAFVAYAAAGAFLGLGIAWSVDARNKEDAARALAAQLHQTGGETACASKGGATAKSCLQLVSSFQSADTSGGYRNAWYIASGVFAAVGVTSNIIAITLPPTSKGQPASQISLKPGGVVIQGSF